jgi:hypothetical protein
VRGVALLCFWFRPEVTRAAERGTVPEKSPNRTSGWQTVSDGDQRTESEHPKRISKDAEGCAFSGSHARGRRFETCSAHERRGQRRGAMAATAQPPEHWREDRAGDDGVGQLHELLDRRRHLRTSRSTLRPRQFAAAGSPTPKRSCVPTAPSRRRSCGHRRSPPRTIWECWCLGLYLLFWGDEALHHMHRYYAFRLARMRRAWFSDGFSW